MPEVSLDIRRLAHRVEQLVSKNTIDWPYDGEKIEFKKGVAILPNPKMLRSGDFKLTPEDINILGKSLFRLEHLASRNDMRKGHNVVRIQQRGNFRK